MAELLKMYEQLNEEQKANIFSVEQRECLDKLLFFDRLFKDKAFYNAVEEAVGQTAYEELGY